MARRRKKKSWFETAGHSAWSSLVRFVAALADGVMTLIRAAAGALSQCTPAARIAILVGLGLAIVFVWTRLPTDGPAAPVEAVTAETEVEALARVIRSEAGIRPIRERVHVAWATRNLAQSRNQTVLEMACSPCGDQQRGRPVSSVQPALDVDLELADAILSSPTLADPTGGATHFINPQLQDRLARKGAKGYRPYQKVRRTWMRSYKWKPYYRLSPQLEMWGE